MQNKIDTFLHRLILDLHHELNSPVNAILSLADLATQAKETDELKKCLEETKRRGEILLNLMDTLFNFAKLECEPLLETPVRMFSISELLYSLINISVINERQKTEIVPDTLPDPDHDNLEGAADTVLSCVKRFARCVCKMTDTGNVELSAAFRSSDERSFLDICFSFKYGEMKGNVKELMCAKQGAGVYFSGDTDKSDAMTIAFCKLLIERLGGTFTVSCPDEKSIKPVLSFPTRETAPVQATSRNGNHAIIVASNALMQALIKRLCKIAGIDSIKCTDQIPLNRDEFDIAVVSWDIVKDTSSKITTDVLDTIFGKKSCILITDVPPLVIMQHDYSSSRHRYLMHGCEFNLLAEAINEAAGNCESPSAEMDTTNRHLPKGIKVLVIEDDRITQRVMLDMLKQLGCIVVTASDGRAALKAANRKLFDLIFMDMILPDIDGISLISKLRMIKGAEDTPIITVSGSKKYEVECVKNGIVHFMTKPVDAKMLRDAVMKFHKVDNFVKNSSSKMDRQKMSNAKSANFAE